MCREAERAGTAKRLLYAYRVALTGIHLLRTGELEGDLTVLAEPYGMAAALPLAERKRATRELVPLDAGELAVHRAALAALGEALARARAASPLPEEPVNAGGCDAWLVSLRTRELARPRRA